MQQVWALSKGSYSDYRVLAIFETEKDAKAALQQNHAITPDEWDQADRIEPMWYYPTGAVPQQVTRYDMNQDLWDDGTTGTFHDRSFVEWEYDMLFYVGARPRVRQVRAPIHKGEGGRLEVRGTDQQAVRQAFSDHVAMWKANDCRLSDRKEHDV